MAPRTRRGWLRGVCAAALAPLEAWPGGAGAAGAGASDAGASDAGALGAGPPGPGSTEGRAAAPRVLRCAFPAAETGFDPARISDLYSRTVTGHIFDGLYKYDYLARPFLIKPNTAVALPEASADHRRFVVRLRPGIFFADDPAFGGRPRELVAADYVYSLKRFFDPAVNSPVLATMQDMGLVGLEALREEAARGRRPFDYDRPIEGLQAPDRYTLVFVTREPRPRFLLNLATGDLTGAVAREVVQAYGDRIMEHPVGTGPFRLVQWRRSSRIVLERNPRFRELAFDGEPAADDGPGQAIAHRLRGRRLPLVDRVEVSIINESQPRWLSFLDQRLDQLAVPLEFSSLAVPGGEIAPHLARRGIRAHRTAVPSRTLLFFNMEHPVVGGYTAKRVALRRAIGLATDVQREIRLVRRGQAIAAQSVVAPGTWGYDPLLKTSNSDHDLPRARALLDVYGYVDRDGDGWREQPDGKPLVLEIASTPDPLSRQMDELFKRSMDALGVRLVVRLGQWPEQLKAARAGELMMWTLGYSAADPDAQSALNLLYGPAAGGQNLARFRHPRFDALYERMQSLPDGPERLALLREAQRITLAWLPHRYNVHPVATDLVQPWLHGYRRPLYGSQWWQYVDVDRAEDRREREGAGSPAAPQA